ncbi:hypothetical protein DESC_100099 [Desulfosarcina cetonica]|nr:hypothetical protein DESC_100099 [Desulfosarcina cetonica]
MRLHPAITKPFRHLFFCDDCIFHNADQSNISDAIEWAAEQKFSNANIMQKIVFSNYRKNSAC